MSAAPDEWGTGRLDLDAYLTRIGCGELSGSAPAPTAELFQRVHRAHSTSIPFENLDILLGRGIELDIEPLQDKLVRRARGGYCHEQNLLLAAALERLGFTLNRLMARMYVGASHPRTHIALRVEVDGQAFLADVGGGAEAPIDPVPLRPGTHADADGWMRGIERKDSGEWILAVGRDSGTLQPLYGVFDELPARPIDFEVANYWTSTNPQSIFVANLVVHHRKLDHRLALTRNTLVEKYAGHDVSTEIGREQLGPVLTERFGLPLSASELAGLPG